MGTMSDEHERALSRLLATTDRPVTVVAASRAQALAAYENARNAVMSPERPLTASLTPWQREIALQVREAAERGESVSICVPPRNGRSSIARTPPSDHLGACGHELDPWETHLAHHPECPRELCLEDRCDCPEVCPDCCRSCGYASAERQRYDPAEAMED